MRCGCSAICATRSGETRATRIGGVIVFYLGTHEPSAQVVGRNRAAMREPPPNAEATDSDSCAPWILDSGGFSELSEYGEWRTSEDDLRCERSNDGARSGTSRGSRRKTGCASRTSWSTRYRAGTHRQRRGASARTVASFVSLRERVGSLVIPVLQGYAPREYDRCVSLYQDAGR
jgi:hypothetical protein